MNITLSKAHAGYDGEKCYVHARIGRTSDGYVMTAQKLLLAGSDIFDTPEVKTSPDGSTWGAFHIDAGLMAHAEDGAETVVCNFTPALHEKTGVLLGTGTALGYDLTTTPKAILHDRRATAYAVWDSGAFKPWRTLTVDAAYLPGDAGCTQRYDLPCGDILLPVYYGKPNAHVCVLRCGFDGETLWVKAYGDEIVNTSLKRGFGEPSVTFDAATGRYLLTLRSDEAGWVACSDDGLHYTEPKIWTYDDGRQLENYNTQQHFVTLGTRTYLVYTRRGANNDHVFRHRAPLFLAEIDAAVLLRDTEIVITPERGARLGNFGVTQLSEHEAWVIAAEWMQPAGCEKYGSDNTIWVVKLTD